MNTNLNKDTVEDCVANGILLLDMNEPGWRDKINVQELDIASPANCVLSQVYRDKVHSNTESGFLCGVYRLGISGQCHLYGFACTTEESSSEKLKKEWARRLTLPENANNRKGNNKIHV